MLKLDVFRTDLEKIEEVIYTKKTNKVYLENHESIILFIISSR